MRFVHIPVLLVADNRVPFLSPMHPYLMFYTSQKIDLQETEKGHPIGLSTGKHVDPVLVEAFLRCQDQFDLVRERMEDCETVVGVPA